MTETVLTDEQIVEIVAENFELAHRNYDDDMILARAIEQAVLQSPEVVAMRKDAERYRWLRDRNDWNHEPRIPESSGTFWQVATYSPYVITDVTDDDNLDNSIDAAMEAKP